MNNLSPELRDIWTDTYKFHVRFDGMANTAEAWGECCDEAIRLLSRHGNHPLAACLLTAVYEYLDTVRRPDAFAAARKEAGLEAI